MRTLLPVLALLLIGVPNRASAQAPSPSGGGAEPAYRVLRSISGSKGEVRDGKYVVLDPRAEFQVPGDAQVVVYFEWLGSPGPHKLSGTWRGPMATSTTTSFDYVAADRQFGAFWALTLPASIPAGDWELVATIDGQPAGTHPFRIAAAGSAPPPGAMAPRRLPLTRQEIYERSLPALVLVDALDAAGTRLQSGLGVRVQDGTILTSFAAVNGAATLRVRSRDGEAVSFDSLAGLSYRGGWALIPASPAAPGALRRAADPLTVGAACFSFDSPGEGTYVLAAGEVSGVNARPGDEARVSVSFAGLAAPGAPVLNEFGELTAIVPATSGTAGRDTLRTAVTLGPVADIGSVVPIAAIPAPAGEPQSLARLAQERRFLPLPVAARHVLNGGFAAGIQGKGPSATPVDQRSEFTRSDKAIVTFVTWMPKEKFKGTTTARAYDMDNRLLGESKPAKASMRAGDLVLSSWDFPVPAPGVYRVDVLLGDQVAWRGHFTVRD